MKRHWYMIYFGLIIGGLFTLGITMFIRPANHFSENENRVLQQIPAFHLIVSCRDISGKIRERRR